MNVKEFSFSCVSLFSYQGSCRSFLSATAFILYQSCFCLSRTFLTFLLLSNFLTFCCFYFSNSFILSSFQLFVNNFFYLLIILIKFCIFSVTYQRQLWYYITVAHHLSTYFLYFFTQKETLKNGNAFLRVSSIIIVY